MFVQAAGPPDGVIHVPTEMMSKREQRRQHIVELISRNQVVNQDQLLDLLAVEGIETTQATLSRDLRDLGITKGPNGYELVDLDVVSEIDMSDLRLALQQQLSSVVRAGSLLILRTSANEARPLARKIDQAHIPQNVGTIADDDTIFIATRTTSQAREVEQLLKRLMRAAG